MSEVIIYQPGNGTRYEFFVEKISDPNIADLLHISPGGWFVAWINQKCRAFQPSGYLDMWYVAEHFGVNEADGEAIMQLLGHIMGRRVRNPWEQCQLCGLPIHPDQEGVGLCVGCVYKHKLG